MPNAKFYSTLLKIVIGNTDLFWLSTEMSQFAKPNLQTEKGVINARTQLLPLLANLGDETFSIKGFEKKVQANFKDHY